MAKAMRYFCGTIERESEKAVLVSYISYVSVSNPDVMETSTVWLPKSQIEVYHHFVDTDGSYVWKVPAWLTAKNNLPATAKKIVDEVIRSARNHAA